MIDEIHVRNLALIREAVFEPARGMTVVTGETGSGKSALLSALKLLAGERADASCVRQGADSCVVEGRFFVAGEMGDGSVVSRRISSDGRGRVSIDGGMSSVKELSGGLGSTIDLCGQHEHQRLLKPQNHADILDLWIGDEAARARADYEASYEREQAARADLERIVNASQAGEEALEQAKFVLARIDEVNPHPGEYERILEELPVRENAEALARAAMFAHEALSKDGGVLDAVSQAAGELESMASVDPSLGEWARSLHEAGYILEDVAREARSYQDAVEFDPEALAEMQERAASLQGLMRQFGPRIEDVLAKRDEAREAIALAEDSGRLISEAEERLREASEGLSDAARRLHELRLSAASSFSSLVCEQMARLEMGSSAIEATVELKDPSSWTRSGADRVEFLFRAGSGMQLRPLAKIASGGEVSRVMLAIKVVLGERDAAETLVFDEVDAGVGGAVARSLAEVLSELSKTRQLIVVTHLPQVAVLADSHCIVEKREREDGVPETVVRPIDGEERISEIARMLSGDRSQASLEHAKELLGL